MQMTSKWTKFWKLNAAWIITDPQAGNNCRNRGWTLNLRAWHQIVFKEYAKISNSHGDNEIVYEKRDKKEVFCTLVETLPDERNRRWWRWNLVKNCGQTIQTHQHIDLSNIVFRELSIISGIPSLLNLACFG